MARRSTTRPEPVRSFRRGRPEALPWNSELPFLLKQREDGSTYAELADMLADRYGVSVTPQTVRGHVFPHLSKTAKRSYVRAHTEERSAVDSEDARRLATWLLDHPAATRKDAAEALNFPLYRVEVLMPLARETFDGYLIPPVKEGKEQYSDEQMLDAIRMCARDTQVRKYEPLSQYRYADWRNAQEDSLKVHLPSPLAYRRRFGTWTNACESAGLHANPLPRQYDGLSGQDIVVWIAHWLRDLAESERGLVDASQGEYRQWLRKHPQAPSEELIRMRGTWANLLSAASVLEKTVKRLPEPKPVGTEGRVKKHMSRGKAVKRVAVGGVLGGLLMTIGVMAGSTQPNGADASSLYTRPMTTQSVIYSAPVKGRCDAGERLVKVGKAKTVTWEWRNGDIGTKKVKAGRKVCRVVTAAQSSKPTAGLSKDVKVNAKGEVTSFAVPKGGATAEWVQSLGLTPNTKASWQTKALPQPATPAVAAIPAQRLEPVRVISVTPIEGRTDAVETVIEWRLVGGSGLVNIFSADLVRLNPNGSATFTTSGPAQIFGHGNDTGKTTRLLGSLESDYGQAGLPDWATAGWDTGSTGGFAANANSDKFSWSTGSDSYRVDPTTMTVHWDG